MTVVAPDGGTADALETTVYILGPERGLKLVEETPGAAAIYVRLTPEGIKTFESSRFKLVPKAELKDSPGVVVVMTAPSIPQYVRRTRYRVCGETLGIHPEM